jgi:hypothetical protein
MDTLVYRSAVPEYPRCRFVYECGGMRVERELVLGGLPAAARERWGDETARHLWAQVGMCMAAHLFAYRDWDVVRVEAVRLSPAGRALYGELLSRGLAELRLVNGLPLSHRPEVLSAPGAPSFAPGEARGDGSAVLLNGGGKDTVVGAAALAAAGVSFSWLAWKKTPAMERIQAALGGAGACAWRAGEWAGGPRARHRGHQPHGSFLAFLGLLVAYLRGASWAVAANEHSANFASLRADGVEVNHQYPKSMAFEAALASYAAADVVRGVEYFSVLRPLWDLQSARLFAGMPGWLGRVRSCNRGHRADTWCLACPKCAFTWLALSAFAPLEEVAAVFGDAWRSPELLGHVERMCRRDERPLECVGTRDECRVALALALERLHAVGAPPPGAARAAEWCAGTPAGARGRLLADLAPHRIPPALAPAVLAHYRAGLGG